VLCGYAAGVLVRHDAGRPIKVAGNPDHPASLGATDAIAQAEILGFYDPDRAAGLMRDGEPQDWQSLLTALAAQRASWTKTGGAGLRVLTGSVTSPTMARQFVALQQLYPEMRWHQWEPVSRDAVRAGAQLAFGRSLEIVPKLDVADVILALDSDLLDAAPGHVRLAHDFATRRNPTRGPMSRVYAVEPTPTLIGLAADHRFVAGPGDMHRTVVALRDALLHGAAPADGPPWVGEVVADLRAHRGRAFVHAGPQLPAETHALVHALNDVLGGRGTTYSLIDAVEVAPTNQAQSLHDLVADMQAGRVQSLVIIDSNPAFTAPGSLGFADALRRVPFSLALTVESNETSQRTRWSLPQAHPYEAWSDARAFDGTATILQPQAQPLYDGVAPHHLLALLAAPQAAAALDLVRQTWQPTFTGNADRQWHDALAGGIVPNTAAPPTDAKLLPAAGQATPPPPADNPVTLLFRPDPHLWDGRFANNAWLQELPRPLTKLTWDNPLLISPQQAHAMDVRNGDRVELRVGDTTLTVPAWIMPGQASDCAVVSFGFGRTVVGTVGQHTGWNVYPLTGRSEPPALRKGQGREELACAEHHNPIFSHDEDFARHGTLAAFTADPHFLADHKPTPALYRTKPPGPAE